MMRSQLRKELRLELIAIMIFAIIAALCSFVGSPLIKSDGCDGPVWVTMGRAMASGKVVYKEIFDHKGWYLYFLYMIAALISDSSLLGLFVIEAVQFFIELWLLYKMMTLISLTEKQAFFVTIAMSILEMQFHVCASRGNVESFVLVFQYITLFVLTKYVVKKENNHNYYHPAIYMFIHGICAGVAFGIKANMMLMWCPIPFFVAYSLLRERKYRILFKNAVGGVLGVIAAWSPMAVYAIATDSMQDMLWGMIGFNLLYSGNNNGLMSTVMSILDSKTMLMIFAILVWSIIVVFYSKRFGIQEKVLYLLMTLFSVVNFMIGGRVYSHYLLYVVPMCIPAMISIGKFRHFSRLLERCPVYVLLGVGLAIYLFTNRSLIYSLSVNQAKIADYAIETVIKENIDGIDDASILATGINAHYYVDLNVIPKEKYFFMPAISYSVFPEPYIAQRDAIQDGQIDILIVKTSGGCVYGIEEIDAGIWEGINQYYRLLMDNSGNKVYMRNR